MCHISPASCRRTLLLIILFSSSKSMMWICRREKSTALRRASWRQFKELGLHSQIFTLIWQYMKSQTLFNFTHSWHSISQLLFQLWSDCIFWTYVRCLKVICKAWHIWRGSRKLLFYRGTSWALWAIFYCKCCHYVHNGVVECALHKILFCA